MGNSTEKVIVVTGGTKGIGFSIAEAFADRRSVIAICSRTNSEVREAAEKLKRLGSKDVIGMRVDVRNVLEIKDFIFEIGKRTGRIDILVNNAGVSNPQPALEMTEENWDRMIEINLKGTFFCAQSAANVMRNSGGGSIINISSIHAITVVPGQAAYASSKAGIVQMTRILAKEWAEFGIRVNCVAPGSVPTSMNRDYLAVPENVQRNINRIPLRRLGSPQEIANVVLFLASSNASYITGQVLYVDGGWTLS